ncbi:MAG: PIN domain-containing protein [Candidatus Sericytochromatia bacterium]|nr:PIN domain-containing protein [Candidatus Sericytochromatia bacterium]
MTHRGDTVEALVLDACVLISLTLRHVFFHAAVHGLCRLHWSDRILDEATHNLIRMGHLDRAGATFLIAAVTESFPGARVTVPEAVVAMMRNDAGDRHVAAAAVVAEAPTIVTVNLRDFPPPALPPWAIEATHPDRVLLRLWGRYPAEMAIVMQDMAGDAPEGYDPWEATLYALRRVTPRFARTLGAFRSAVPGP